MATNTGSALHTPSWSLIGVASSSVRLCSICTGLQLLSVDAVCTAASAKSVWHLGSDLIVLIILKNVNKHLVALRRSLQVDAGVAAGLEEQADLFQVKSFLAHVVKF